MGVFENEKRLRKGKKFEEKETRGDKFRRKLKEETREDTKKESEFSKPKFDKSLENAIENLKEDSRFPQKPERKKRLGPAPKTRRPKPFRVPGKEKIMTPLAKGGRAMLRGGGICKKGMNKKAVGKNS